MKVSVKFWVLALALALPSAAWADRPGPFADDASAFNYGEDTATRFTSMFYNTVRCRTSGVYGVDAAEERLANILGMTAGLESDGPKSQRMAYYAGFYFGWLSQTLVEYNSCRAARFDTVPMPLVSRAAAVVLGLMLEDLGNYLNGHRIDLRDAFNLDYAFLGALTAEERNDCAEAIETYIDDNFIRVNNTLVNDVIFEVCR